MSKKTPKVEKTPKAGKGKKTCPKCKKIIGARSSKCDCGHVFPVKTKSSTSKTSFGKRSKIKDKKDNNNLILSDITSIIKKAGGLKEVKSAIENYNKVVGTIDKIGGIQKAETIVKEIEKIKTL